MFLAVKKMHVLNFKKSKNEGVTSTFFLVSHCFQIQRIHFFTFEYIRKQPKIKQYQIEIKIKMVWRKKVACRRIFYHFPAGGEFLLLFTSYGHSEDTSPPMHTRPVVVRPF